LLDSLLQEMHCSATYPLCMLLLVIVSVHSAPHNIIKKAGNFPLVHGDADVASLTALKPRSKKWHLEPVSVTKINKKDQDKENSVSEVKESHSVFSDLNGNRHGFKQENQQVSENGKLVSNIFHQEKNHAKAGHEPHVEALTELDIPELDIHGKVLNKDGVTTTLKKKRNGKVPAPPPYSAAELAGYVLETGDQASVVQLLEMLLKEGKISEEEALDYVETIKSYLEEAKKASDHSENEEEKIREILLERKLEEQAMEEKMEEEEAAKAAFVRSLINAEQAENNENESILKINKFLESSLKQGKMSRGLYKHLKEALIESVVEDTNPNMDSLDYGQY